jgi:cold shock CspA family protein
MRVKLRKALPLTRILLSRVSGAEDRDALGALSDWLGTQGDEYVSAAEESGGQTPAQAPASITSDVSSLRGERAGTIRMIDPVKRFGFIRSQGEDFFFHRSDLVSVNMWAQLDGGVRVSFSVTENQKGPRAIGVQLD